MDIGHKGDSDLYATQHPISDEYLVPLPPPPLNSGPPNPNWRMG